MRLVRIDERGDGISRIGAAADPAAIVFEGDAAVWVENTTPSRRRTPSW
jgi:hypothetical protein